MQPGRGDYAVTLEYVKEYKLEHINVPIIRKQVHIMLIILNKEFQ